ncbi:MAG TPA: 50S ribosomal protein L18 [Candidatus Eremiobacteraeota bacterium]|nr:MAG: 50S ribosomal protein L18 [bacterium ADurb.Bin363]HPZ08171.1 50S ribosomal protein L18 [Candidatus Eremiobacteraeota bacterium]
MITLRSRNKERDKRHLRIRKKVIGNSGRPRLCVFRSLEHIYAQIIDDSRGETLVSASSLDKDVKEKVKELEGKKEVAKMVGNLIARRAAEKNITLVVFDRGGYKYHGRVKNLGDGAREGGLIF